MNKIKIVCLLSIVWLASSLTVYADNLPLGVKVVDSSNLELKEELNFKLKPGESTQAEVELVNKSASAKTVAISINSASNDENGQLIYNSSQAQVNNAKLASVPKVVRADKQVVIEGNSRLIVPLSITMPKQPFKGVILGGITFLDESSRGEKQDNSAVGIVNEMSYTLPIILRQSDETEKAQLKLKGVKLSEKAKSLEVAIDNVQGHILPGVDLTYVIKTRSGQVIDTIKVAGAQLAPHHTFAKNIRLDKLPITTSQYKIDIKADSDHGNWNWTETFELSTKQRIEKVKEIIKNEVNWLVVLGAIIIGLLLVLIILQLMKMRRKA